MNFIWNEKFILFIKNVISEMKVLMSKGICKAKYV